MFPYLLAKNCHPITFLLAACTQKWKTYPITADKTHPNSWTFLTTVHVCLQSHVRLGHLFHIDQLNTARKMTSLDSGIKAPDPRCSQSLHHSPCTNGVFERVHAPHTSVPSVAFSHLSAAGEQTSGQERTSGMETGDRWDKGNLGWNRLRSHTDV